jgi:Leucine-rich repeat (LRR) protein
MNQDSIGNLTNLTTLFLSSNKLTKLPDSIGNLVNITTLSLWYNRLTELPVGIRNLTKITSLNLANNPVDEIMKSLTLEQKLNYYYNLERLNMYFIINCPMLEMDKK